MDFGECDKKCCCKLDNQVDSFCGEAVLLTRADGVTLCSDE